MYSVDEIVLARYMPKYAPAGDTPVPAPLTVSVAGVTTGTSAVVDEITTFQPSGKPSGRVTAHETPE